ncbi:hypothetical protein FP371_23135 [Citrobacter freundii]|nr:MULTISPECIES: hypothetical protein [Gammaproteobacteria]EEA2350736.1 hypothetical protein [Salmonella enterica subsp. enterica serovar Enteritidis]EEC4304156.1 hypothetical protein [Salmonella enterica subsp. enterica serovar Enteritidis]EEN2406580.1 hypothetical protein [Salmonella enterica subsp. enterica serovar Enteritidis]EES8921626.1 hypothetical protein [Escherichia coli]EES9862944.1 hypothetical protein [Escherichia coli]
MKLPALLAILMIIPGMAVSTTNVVTPYYTTVYLPNPLAEASPGNQVVLIEPYSQCLYYGALSETGAGLVTPQYNVKVESRLCGERSEKVAFHTNDFNLSQPSGYPIMLLSD